MKVKLTALLPVDGEVHGQRGNSRIAVYAHLSNLRILLQPLP